MIMPSGWLEMNLEFRVKTKARDITLWIYQNTD